MSQLVFTKNFSEEDENGNIRSSELRYYVVSMDVAEEARKTRYGVRVEKCYSLREEAPLENTFLEVEDFTTVKRNAMSFLKMAAENCVTPCEVICVLEDYMFQ